MPAQSIDQVFFLDRIHGWIVSQQRDSPNGQSVYYFFSTTNGGKHWSLLKFEQKTYGFVDQLSPGQIFFSDPEHGWILFNLMVTHFEMHALLVTTDGGERLRRLSDPPGHGPFTFISPEHGWLIGHMPSEGLFPKSDQIWATHDGGATWDPVPIHLPTNSSPVIFAAFKMESPDDGVLAAKTYPSETEENLFSCTTRSGGSAWKCAQFSAYSAKPSIVDLHILWSATDYGGPERSEKVTVRSGARVISPELPRQLSPRGFLGAVHFIDDAHGWTTYVNLTAARPAGLGPEFSPVDLLSTSDGGKTFHVITPSAALRTPNGRAQRK